MKKKKKQLSRWERRRRKAMRKHRLKMGVPRYRELLEPSILRKIGRSQIIHSNKTILLDELVLASEPAYGKRCWDELHLGPPYVSGGPLTLYYGGLSPNTPFKQNEGVYYGADTTQFPNGSKSIYTGGFFPNGFGTGSPTNQNILDVGDKSPFDEDSFGDPSQYDAEAYNKFKPKQSFSNAAQFLGEIGETPMMLKTTAKFFANAWKTLGGHPTLFAPKPVADQFLNHQFGWVPFLNDLKSFHKTYENSSKYLDQLRRDNGKWIKRGGEVRTTSSISDHASFGGSGKVFPSLTTGFYKPFAEIGTNRVHSETYKKIILEVTFAARFRYYIDDLKVGAKGIPLMQHVRNLLRVYGVRVNPSVLWKITPWSWLLDWNANIGTVLDNLVNRTSDQLVSKYAYTMKHVDTQYVNFSTIHLKGGDRTCFWSMNVGSKTRRAANPYGFSSKSWSDFTPRQIAIFAALGINRL